MARMHDVARLAKVSTATVSRVLSDDKRISDATKEKVLQAVQKLGYKPNQLASNFARKSSKTVVVVLQDITNPFFARVVQGLEDVAHRRGYHVLLGDTRHNPALEHGFYELVKGKLADGVILATSGVLKSEILEVIDDIPIVLACGRIDGVDVSSVAIDNVKAAYAATDYLIRMGHQRIAFISQPLLKLGLNGDRLDGYSQALEANGLSFHPELVREGDYTSKSGYEMTMDFLRRDNPPTAVFAASDEMAVGAMKAIKACGLRIPQDVSVMGFDDIPLCTLVEPELTTVKQPGYDIGADAMGILLNIIEGDDTRQQITLPHELMVRGTVAPVK